MLDGPVDAGDEPVVSQCAPVFRRVEHLANEELRVACDAISRAAQRRARTGEGARAVRAMAEAVACVRDVREGTDERRVNIRVVRLDAGIEHTNARAGAGVLTDVHASALKSPRRDVL